MKAIIAALLVFLAGCTMTAQEGNMATNTGNKMDDSGTGDSMDNNRDDKMTETATFAGGCFWCIEAAFENEGIEAISGFAGGETENPSYEQVSSGSTEHVEAVQFRYDPAKISYRELLDIFWRQINPTDDGGQFNDRGFQYTTAIFYHNEEQKRLAEQSRNEIQKRFDKPVVTRILPFTNFYRAEEYHQDYHRKNPIRYKFYRSGSGRDKYIEETWSDEADLRSALTPLQYKVTQEDGTEPPFDNEYWNNTEPGIYVDIVSGEPLFSSKDQFKSGTGWPSFTKPLEPENIVEKKDYKLIIPRTEVRSREADSHLGHVFRDGPEPTGLRYCMNSAAMRFIPADKLEEEGYGEYSQMFS